ncbi:MAG: hypothetical protein NVS9B4_17390 [Candidatus Acidiferrum sp.]
MSPLFFFVLVAILLALLFWALRNPQPRAPMAANAASLEDTDYRHVTHLSQIRQALAPTDFQFLSSIHMESLGHRLRKERHSIVLAYLPTLREDFARLLRLARAITILSPKVHTVEEWERLRMTVEFHCRYEIIRFSLKFGMAPTVLLSNLSETVSALSVRMETAMTMLGERAVAAMELASSIDDRGVDVA